MAQVDHPSGSTAAGPAAGGAAPGNEEGSAGSPVKVGWRHVIPLPIAALGVAGLIWGMVYAAKTAPRIDYGGGLTEASTLMDQGQYSQALGVLNDKILPHVGGDALTPKQTQAFFLLRARALYLGQLELGINRTENHENILKEYKEAVTRHAELEVKDQVYRAETLLKLGEYEKAIEVLDAIAPVSSEAVDARRRLQMRLIDEALNGRPPRHEAALELLSQLAGQPELSSDDRVWVLQRQASLLLAQGFAEEAITRILRAMPRIEAAPPDVTGEVLLTLGEAYLAQEEPVKAGEQLERALTLMGESHALAPRAARLLGDVDHYIGGERISRAYDRYSHVLETWSASPEARYAKIGLAEVEAALANTEAPQLLEKSLTHYEELVAEALGEPPPSFAEAADESAAQGAVQVAKPAEDAAAGGEANHEGSDASKASHSSESKPDSADAETPHRQGSDDAATPHRGKDESPSKSNGNSLSADAIGGHAAAGTPRTGTKAREDTTKASSSDVDSSFKARLLASLMARFVEQFDKKSHEVALRFGGLAEKLAGRDRVPADLLLGLAKTHRDIATELLAAKSVDGSALSLAQVDPPTQREARNHLLRAAEYYRGHAARVVAADIKAYGDSLWAAAEMFDRVGDLSGSAAAFDQFANDFPSDSRKPEALFRLAETHRARGDLELAEREYRSLIANRGDSRLSGPFADASYVPLAKTLLTAGKPGNEAEAENLLQTVIRGEVGGTATMAFGDALQTLGEYYYDSGRHEQAIERIGEYLERQEGLAPGAASAGVSRLVANSAASIGSGGRGAGVTGEEASGDGSARGERNTSAASIFGLRFKLADAYRQSAIKIAASFATAMPDSQRRQLEQARIERLEKAVSLFDELRRDYERLPHCRALDELRMRNAYFFQADCAFDLKDYDTAIRMYDAAKERYPKDAASLVAMVQIVAALIQQGRMDEAATANARAKRFYESLPESAWDDPNLPMGRKQWEVWLQMQSKLATVNEK